MLRAKNSPMPTNAPRLHARAAFATLGVLFSVIAATASLPTKAIAAGSVKIVAKVGDLVITNFQVDARAALLMQQSAAIRKQAGASAQSYFKKNVQKRWKKITQTDKFKKDLRDYVIGKRPTSREEQQKYIREFAQKRQRRLQKSLQKEALAHGQRAVGGTLKKKALDNLIDESLKLYEAKRLSVLASYDEAKKSIAQIAQRNNKTVKEFEANLRKSGIQPMTLRDKIRADKSWQNVIRKQYGFQLAMMQSALDRYIDTAGGGNATAGGDVKLDVKRIRIASNDPGAGLVQALQQADGLRNRISGCQSLSGAASTVPGARFEDLGKRTADAIANPVVRELLKKARVGEPIPPQIESGNVDLWVLCGRDQAGGSGPGPAAKPRKSRKQDPRAKEFETLARRHLNDLRREVRVEYK